MEDRVSNRNSIQGNSQAYTLARLKRDRPDLVELVLAGELSANAAATVFEIVAKPATQVAGFLDKAKHLSASSSAASGWVFDGQICLSVAFCFSVSSRLSVASLPYLSIACLPIVPWRALCAVSTGQLA